MAKAMRERFFIDVLEPQLMQTWVASCETQQNRIGIKLIVFFSAEIHCISDMKLFVQFRDGNPHIDCTITSHCSSSEFRCTAAGNSLFYTWRTQRARNFDRHQQTSIATQINWALWSYFWRGEKWLQHNNVCWSVLSYAEAVKTSSWGLLIFVSANLFCQGKEFWLPALQIPFRKCYSFFQLAHCSHQ